MSILSILPWNKIIQLAVNLITRSLEYSDNLKHLEKDWLKFTRSLSISLPVNFSEKQKVALAKLQEEQRQTNAKINHIKKSLENYKEQNAILYSKNLKLEDQLLKSKASREF